MKEKRLSNFVTSTDTPKEIHKRLVTLLYDKGEKFPKRHGNWVRLRIKGKYFLEMDSWNKSVRIKYGTGEPLYHKGNFKGKSLHHFGMDFGSYEVPKSQHMGIFWIYTAFYS